jgi:hypothetical protein
MWSLPRNPSACSRRGRLEGEDAVEALAWSTDKDGLNVRDGSGMDHVIIGRILPAFTAGDEAFAAECSLALACKVGPMAPVLNRLRPVHSPLIPTY